MVFSKVILLASLCLLLEISGHGYMLSPPGRASMWRVGWSTPRDYGDNQLYCGGFYHQWEVNGGKCGVCGDSYDGVKVHETGGKYATGTVVRHYRRAQITANHFGYIEFRICKVVDYNKEVTQECLNNGSLLPELCAIGPPYIQTKRFRNVLRVDMEGNTRYQVNTSRTGEYHVTVILPRRLKCDRCLLQWKYHAGNSWGVGRNGRACVGCGPQEEFYACADVRISENGGHLEIPTTETPPTSTGKIDPNEQLPFCPGGKYKASYLYRHQKKKITKWCMVMCNIHRPDRNCPKTHCRCV